MAAIAGEIYVKDANKMCIVDPTDIRDFRLKLNNEKVYMVGIDQSTTCTGIFIVDTTFNYYLAFDVKREIDSKDDYFASLFRFFNNVLGQVEVSLIVHEEPVPCDFAATSKAVLMDLRGRLREWMRIIPSLKEASLRSLYPQTWKTNVVSKEYADRVGTTVKKICTSKAKMADRICNLYPFLQQYRRMHFSKDYDAFDAAGILTGWLRYSTDDKGNPRICGIKEQRHVSLVGYTYRSVEEIQKVSELQDFLGDAKINLNPIYLAYNRNYTKHANIRMASSNWRAVVTIIPVENVVSTICWKFGIQMDPNKVMIMFVFRKGALKQYDIDWVKYYLPCNEEVYNA